MLVLNSRDQHEKRGVPLLRTSITRLTIYFTRKSQLKCIGNTIRNNTVPLLTMQSVENFKIFDYFV